MPLDEIPSIDNGRQNTTDHQGCFFFAPPEAVNKSETPRPAKRRKISKPLEETRAAESRIFVPLLGGVEANESIISRNDVFTSQWARQEILFENVFQTANESIMNEVSDFVRDVNFNVYDERLPSGFIVAGPNIAAHTELFDALVRRFEIRDSKVVINITSHHASNLKMVLKHIIGEGIRQIGLYEDDIPVSSHHQGPRRLNYDLHILHEHLQIHPISKVVLLFQDSEAFDNTVLADLIAFLRSWRDRIPFVLLFGIATSIDTFLDNLPRATVRSLLGTRFHVVQAEATLEDVFESITSRNLPKPLWLGPELSTLLLERQKNHVQSIRAFVKSVQYAVMAHFYTNPLSCLLAADPSEILKSEHFEAVRNLPSFKRLAEDLLDQRSFKKLRQILDDDRSLQEVLMDQLNHGQKSLRGILEAVELIRAIQACMPNVDKHPWSALYVQAMSGTLVDSVAIKELLLSIRKLPSNLLDKMIADLAEIPSIPVSEIRADLADLIQNLHDSNTSLRSEHDIQNETLRTTIVAQKVELSRQKSTLSKQDTAYSKIVDRVDKILKKYFIERLINPRELYFHEIFLYDMKSSYREAFTPKSRFAIERALCSPQDYLACDCCSGSGDVLSSSRPATAILYQLCLESGALINISDLWSAFYTILDGDQEAYNEQEALALFYRALAELKYMGMIQASKKRKDHLAKLTWKWL